MPWAAAAIVAGAGITAYSQYKSGKEASKSQSEAAKEGIDVEQQQFEAIQELFKPYIEAGQESLQAQKELAGLGGTVEQQKAIEALQQSPQYQELLKSGEESILQRASATGGLRGGNIQGALGQFRPQLLAQTIEQQYGRLGGITGLGQASAAGQAAQGSGISANVANLLQQQGAAQAGGALATGQAIGGLGGTAQTLGTMSLLGAF